MNRVTVYGIEFRSNAALARHARGIVERYRDGEPMTWEHAQFMFDLIVRRHPWSETKLIPGRLDEIVGIRVLHESGCPKFGNARTNRNHCRVVYSNGDEIDFSWKKCCEGSFSVKRDVDHAMRRAAERHVREYKRRRFAAVGGMPTCDATGVPLTSESCQVDHYPLTWVAIRDRFLASEGVEIESVQTASVVPQGGCALADQSFAERFEKFHDATATLRLVTTEVNARSWRDENAIRK